MTFEAMWRDLAPLGRSVTTGGYHRQPFAGAERECHGWFVEQCRARGLEVEADGNGNVVAWWRPAGCRADGGVVTGSHLDSVPDGGAYDGPLGVVSALAAVACCGTGGSSPRAPSASRCSSRRRGRGSASPAWARGC